MATYRGYVRYISTGEPVSDGTTVEFRSELDNALLASTTTVGGEFEIVRHGSFPPHRIVTALGGEVHVQTSKTVGMTGAVNLSLLPYLIQVLSDGVVRNVLNELAVTANGANMNLSVQSGVAIARGIIYDQLTSTTLTVEAADPIRPRIDTVAIEVVPAGAGEDIEGESKLVLVKGEPSSAPNPPSLIQSATKWQIPIADIRVDTGATAIGQNKVTDRRTYAAAGFNEDDIKAIVDDVLTQATASSTTGTEYAAGDIFGVFLRILQIDKEWLEDYVNDMIVAGSNITKSYNDATGKITISATVPNGGSAPSGAPARLHKDTNFGTTGALSSGTRNLGTASITLPAGTYLIHSQVNLSCFSNNGNLGYVTLKLTGNGAPAGSEQSSRNFRIIGSQSRQCILTGRRKITLTQTTTVSVTAQATPHSGAPAYLEDGVVFLWAE